MRLSLRGRRGGGEDHPHVGLEGTIFLVTALTRMDDSAGIVREGGFVQRCKMFPVQLPAIGNGNHHAPIRCGENSRQDGAGVPEMLQSLDQEKIVEAGRQRILQQIATAGGDHRLLGRSAADLEPFDGPERTDGHQPPATVAQPAPDIQNSQWLSGQRLGGKIIEPKPCVRGPLFAGPCARVFPLPEPSRVRPLPACSQLLKE